MTSFEKQFTLKEGGPPVPQGAPVLDSLAEEREDEGDEAGLLTASLALSRRAFTPSIVFAKGVAILRDGPNHPLDSPRPAAEPKWTLVQYYKFLLLKT
jgi:hypothetical protein